MNRLEIPLQHSLNPTKTDHCQPEVNSSDGESPTEELGKLNELSEEAESSPWELRMAKLVGLEDESLTSDASEVEDLAMGQPAPEQEEEVHTEQTLSSNPLAKLGLVGSATLTMVLLAGVFLSQIMNIGQSKPSQNKLVASEPQEQPKTESQLQELEAEMEILKTKLALAEQAEAVKIAQQNLRKETPKPKANSTPPKKPTPLALPAIAPTVNVPRVVFVEPPVRQLPPPVPEKTTAVTEKKTPDPLQEWMRLAKLGSYGQVSASAEPRLKRQAQKPTPEPRLNRQALNPAPAPEPMPPSENLAVRPAREQSPKSVAIGSSARAVLATAVFGETTKARSRNPNEERETVFVVRLQEPLKAVNGEIALPVNTELLVKIRSLSERGLLKLNVVKVIMQDDGNLSERSLPPNAIAIQAPDGKPLLAEQFPNQAGSIASMDAGLFLLGGLGKAAELLNRTESEIITTNSGSTVVSSSNSQRNLSAGVLEGGIQTIVPRLAQRNQQLVSQMMQQTNIWFMPAGTKVEIYVNQMLQF